MTAPTHQLGTAHRRRLLLRYIHHVERTGLSLYPALEQHLCNFQAQAKRVDPLPAAAAVPEPLTSPVPPVALPMGPVVTVNTLINSAAPAGPLVSTPLQEMVHTVDTYAVDPGLDDLEQQLAAGRQNEPLLVVQDHGQAQDLEKPDDPTPIPPDLSRRALIRSIQATHRTGRCNHPALEARLQALVEVPAVRRCDSAVALNTGLATSRQLLQSLQEQLLAPTAATAISPAALSGIVVQLRSCRRSLVNLLVCFGTELQAPLLANMRRQLHRTRRLDWRLRIELLRRTDEHLLTSLALAAVHLLQSVVPFGRPSVPAPS